jgi:hypothetical protein
MLVNYKNNSESLLNKGLRELIRHRPDKALEPIRSAVEAIPPSRSAELARALYWLSVALFRLDKRDLAVKSLASSQKLRGKGFARKLYLRNINQYGMPKRSTRELDDFYAFSSLQMAHYLVKRPNNRFESFMEQEIVSITILQSWETLSASLRLDDISCAEKLDLFKHTKISFPRMSLYTSNTPPRFNNNRLSTVSARQPQDRCSCGSGLPYSMCCGRTKGLGEL